MNRAAASLFLTIALTCGLAACGGDDETEPPTPTFDFTPVATISVTDDGISCSTAPTGVCRVEVGAVVAVENPDQIDHRLVGATPAGDSVFDTGTMQPGDQMTLVLSTDGTVTVTDTLWPDGDAPTMDIVVAASDDG